MSMVLSSTSTLSFIGVLVHLEFESVLCLHLEVNGELP